MPFRQRSAGGLQYFERAGDPDGILRPYLRRAVRIVRGELRMQRRCTLDGEPLAETGTNDCRDRRDRRETSGQRLEVQPRTSHQDWDAGLARSLDQYRFYVSQPVPDRIVLRGVDMAVQPVRRARLLVCARARGQDPQIAIDLHGIRVDDHALELLRERQRKPRLAARGRACDKHRPLQTRLAGARMSHVATLISNPAVPALDDDVLARIAHHLSSADAPRWLAPGIAADVCFTLDETVPPKMLAGELRSEVDGAPIDVVVQRSAGRRKRLLVADMESTIIG